MSWALLRKLWLSPIARIAVVALVLIGSVWGFGHTRYRAGHADGVTQQKTTGDSIATIAAAAEATARAHADSMLAAARFELAAKDRAIAALKERSAMDRGQYRQALAFYQQTKAAALAAGDTLTTPTERACAEVASTCANALASATAERVGIEDKLAIAERIVAQQDSAAQLEPVRTHRAVTTGIAQDRATRKTPSRVGWFSAGALVGVLLEVLR